MPNFAVYAGIGYKGTENSLPGTGPDVRDMSAIYKANGYGNTILSDFNDLTYDDGSPMPVAGLPTKENIIAQVTRVLKNAKAGDKVLFYISGHGTNMNGQDYLVPLNVINADGTFNESELLSSQELHALCMLTPPGVDFEFVADTCFSGNITALTNNARSLNPADKLGELLANQVPAFQQLHTLLAQTSRNVTSQHGNITFVAGCKANQESTDLGTNGALTFAIKSYINANHFAAYQSMIFNYLQNGAALSKFKSYITSVIKQQGVTTQDPQVSWSADTTIAPAAAPAKPTTVAPAAHHNYASLFTTGGFFSWLHSRMSQPSLRQLAGGSSITADTAEPDAKKRKVAGITN